MSRVIVVGSINVDLVATVERFPRSGETLLGRSLDRFPGGKGANQAIAAARAGAQTQMIGAVGDDDFGRQMREFLAENAIATDGVATVSGVSTGVALITVCAGENAIVVIPGANAALAPAQMAAIAFAPGDVVVTQLEIPLETVAATLDAANRSGAITILNAAPMLDAAAKLARRCHVLIVNEIELGGLAGTRIDADTPAHLIAQAADQVRAGAGQTVITTLGARGAIVVGESRWFEVPGRSVPVVDTTGAGDCFTGACAAQLAARRSLQQAATFANAAASICVQRAGAGVSMPTRNEIESVVAG